LNHPSLELIVAINAEVREHDEWFGEPDDVVRVEAVLTVTSTLDDPVLLAATLAYLIAKDQAFGEGNKRTALLVARWVLDHNGLNGARFIPSADRILADLLVKAAMGANVGVEVVSLFRSREV
jgi:prophage maintenance system killer protein